MGLPPPFRLDASPPSTSPAGEQAPVGGAGGEAGGGAGADSGSRRSRVARRLNLAFSAASWSVVPQRRPSARMALRFTNDDQMTTDSPERRFSLLSSEATAAGETSMAARTVFARLRERVEQRTTETVFDQAWRRLLKLCGDEGLLDCSHGVALTYLERRLEAEGLAWIPDERAQTRLLCDSLLVRGERVEATLKALLGPPHWAAAARELASRGCWEALEHLLEVWGDSQPFAEAVAQGARLNFSDECVTFLEQRGWLLLTLRPLEHSPDETPALLGRPPLARLISEERLREPGLRSCLHADPDLRLDSILPGSCDSIGTAAAARGWCALLAEFSSRMADPRRHYGEVWIDLLARRQTRQAEQLFQLGAGARGSHPRLQEALIAAVSEDRGDMALHLVQAGADPTALRPYSSLLETQGVGSARSLMILPVAGAPHPQMCPLWLSARLSHPRLCLALLDYGADASVVGPGGEHLLVHACASGSADVVLALLQDPRVPLQLPDAQSVACAIWRQPLLREGAEESHWLNVEVWNCYVEAWRRRERGPLATQGRSPNESLLESMVRLCARVSPAHLLEYLLPQLEQLAPQALHDQARAQSIVLLLREVARHTPGRLPAEPFARLLMRLLPESEATRAQLFEGFGFEEPFWRLVLEVRERGLVEALAASGCPLHVEKGSALLLALQCGFFEEAQRILELTGCPENHTQTALRLLLEGPSRQRGRLLARLQPHPPARAAVLPLLLSHCSRLTGRAASGEPLSVLAWRLLPTSIRWKEFPRLISLCDPIDGDLESGSLLLQSLFDAHTPDQEKLVWEQLHLHPEWWAQTEAGWSLIEQLLILAPYQVRQSPDCLPRLQRALTLWRAAVGPDQSAIVLNRLLRGFLPLEHGLLAGAEWLESLFLAGASPSASAGQGPSFVDVLLDLRHERLALQILERHVLTLSPQEAQTMLPVALRGGSIPATRNLLQDGASLQSLAVTFCPLVAALRHHHIELALWICDPLRRQEFGARAYNLEALLQAGTAHPFLRVFPPYHTRTIRLLELLAPTLQARWPPSGDTLLHLAVHRGPAWIPHLLRLGLSPRLANIHGETPVHQALHLQLPDEIVLALCPVEECFRIVDGRGQNVLRWAALYRRQSLLAAWMQQAHQQADPFAAPAIYEQALDFHAASAVAASLPPPVTADLWNQLRRLFRNGDRGTVTEVLMALERVFHERSPQTQEAMVSQAADWLEATPEVARHFLTCAPSLVPHLTTADFPPPICLPLRVRSELDAPRSLEVCHRAATAPAQVTEQITALVEQIALTLSSAAELMQAARHHRTRGLSAMQVALGSTSTPSWNAAVLVRLLQRLEIILHRAQSCQDAALRRRACVHFGQWLRADEGWRWHLEQLMVVLPPPPEAALEIHLSHALLTMRYAALEQALCEVFGELPPAEEGPSRAAISDFQRSCLLDAYGVALGLLQEPWLWDGRVRTQIVGRDGTDYLLSPFLGDPDAWSDEGGLLAALNRSMESQWQNQPLPPRLLEAGGPALEARLLRALLAQSQDAAPTTAEWRSHQIERCLRCWGDFVACWRLWQRWEKEGEALHLGGLRLMRILTLSSFRHRLNPPEEPDASPPTDADVVQDSLQLLRADDEPITQQFLEQGLILLHQMEEAVSELVGAPSDPASQAQPQLLLINWLSAPAEAFEQMQASLFGEARQLLAPLLGMQHASPNPTAESLTRQFLSDFDLEELLVSQGFLLRTALGRVQWGGC